jgi:hypothetical protein
VKISNLTTIITKIESMRWIALWILFWGTCPFVNGQLFQEGFIGEYRSGDTSTIFINPLFYDYEGCFGLSYEHYEEDSTTFEVTLDIFDGIAYCNEQDSTIHLFIDSNQQLIPLIFELDDEGNIFLNYGSNHNSFMKYNGYELFEDTIDLYPKKEQTSPTDTGKVINYFEPTGATLTLQFLPNNDIYFQLSRSSNNYCIQTYLEGNGSYYEDTENKKESLTYWYQFTMDNGCLIEFEPHEAGFLIREFECEILKQNDCPSWEGIYEQ